MKKRPLIIWMCVFNFSFIFAQVSVTDDGSSPANSAMLEVKSTEKGFLPPRMTQAQIGEIAGPADGLMVYCTTDSKLYIYNATSGLWKEVTFGTGIITPPFTCGMPITINHIAGNVAPVNKTVIYGTVSNIPGETKCWITSNLGADHQATAVDDATEASAGWYWQFNRKQGYKYDVSTITPAWTITEITENSDWQAENDPCAIEMGNGWRIPTNTEWYNVDNAGSWTDWNGPWNSGLKLHAAGYLLSSDGSLYGRGSYGYYWSSTQLSNSNGRFLSFLSSYCEMNNGNKATGRSLRCLRE